MQTPANFYVSSDEYFYNAYPKAEAFLWHLRYVVGDEAFGQAMLRYSADWHFKHPTGDDFLRAMERSSGMELDWLRHYFLGTNKFVDYAVGDWVADGTSATLVALRRVGEIPLPVEVLVRFRDGTSERHYIPLDYQLGTKKGLDAATIVHEAWNFVAEDYSIRINRPRGDIQSVTIDPDKQTSDANLADNSF